MRRSASVALALGFILSVGVAVTAMAHEGTGEEAIEVEPSAIAAGDSVVLAGSGLEPNDERVIVLVGEHDTLHLTEVDTDDEGMFSLDVAIPGHLPAGTYELQAIGDETLTVPLAVTARAGAEDAPDAANPPGETVVPRERSGLELGVILTLVAVSAAVGGWLIRRAERPRAARTT